MDAQRSAKRKASTNVNVWRKLPAHLILTDGIVHVWRADLDRPRSVVHKLQETLSDDEARRADHFCFERDRTQFIVSRGLLRAILGRYLGVDPGTLCFHYNRFGKPTLEPASNPQRLHFNVSHSAGLALYALATQEVGVDVEQIRTDLQYMQIAATNFSPLENVLLRMLPAELQPRGFFNCWTRKEAYIKARGLGLSLPLDQFDVSLSPGEPARLLRTSGEPEAVTQWSLWDLNPRDDFAAALAIAGHAWQVAYWQLDAESDT